MAFIFLIGTLQMAKPIASRLRNREVWRGRPSKVVVKLIMTEKSFLFLDSSKRNGHVAPLMMMPLAMMMMMMPVMRMMLMVQVATVGAVQVDQQQKTSDFVRISHELGHVDVDVGEAVHVQPMMIIL